MIDSKRDKRRLTDITPIKVAALRRILRNNPNIRTLEIGGMRMKISIHQSHYQNCTLSSHPIINFFRQSFQDQVFLLKSSLLILNSGLINEILVTYHFGKIVLDFGNVILDENSSSSTSIPPEYTSIIFFNALLNGTLPNEKYQEHFDEIISRLKHLKNIKYLGNFDYKEIEYLYEVAPSLKSITEDLEIHHSERDIDEARETTIKFVKLFQYRLKWYKIGFKRGKTKV